MITLPVQIVQKCDHWSIR